MYAMQYLLQATIKRKAVSQTEAVGDYQHRCVFMFPFFYTVCVLCSLDVYEF